MKQGASDLEINHNRVTRIFEIIPGLSAWIFLLAPIVLSLFWPVAMAYIIIAYYLMWLTKSFGLSHRLIRGYSRLHRVNRVRWLDRLPDLKNMSAAISRLSNQINDKRLSRYKRLELRQYRKQLIAVTENQVPVLDPDQVYHAVILAVFNESLDILEPTVKALTAADYPLKRLWLFIAYEERGGEATKQNVDYLVKTYGHYFGHATAIKHPANIPHEVQGKGGNITYAGQKLAAYVRSRHIAADHVVVTVFDADNRPAPYYFAYLTFVYCSTPERVHKSYQPMPMFYNNIWDVPAPMRVIATGNSFWITLTDVTRPHRMRNFSSHAQSLQTLIDTNFWSVRTVVEDGHQFWRTYFTYNGHHEVIPIFVPVYQDAVLARGYLRTFKAQFIQLRRWAYGASDISYVALQSLRNKQVSFFDKSAKLLRLFESHFTWATAPLVLALAAWLPLLLNRSFTNQVLAHQLPVIASRIQTLALVGVVITIFLSIISLPPRPAHYRRRHSILMVLQWVLLPVTTIFFASFAALNAQTRLMFGRYLGKFDVTEKATKRAARR